MNFKKAILSIIASAVVACTTLGGVASAATIDSTDCTVEFTLQSEDDAYAPQSSLGTASPYGADVPSSSWDWSKGNYNGKFESLYRNRYVNTNYKFKTGTGQLTITMNLYATEDWSHDREMKVELYGKGTTIFDTWQLCDYWYIPISPDSSNHSKIFSDSHTFNNLSNNKSYYIKFYNSSSVVDSDYTSANYAIKCQSFSVSV